MPTDSKKTAKPAKAAVARTAKPARPRMTLAEVMSALELAGSEQTRKTYRRHGAVDPMFGVSFATLKSLLKAIGVDHELALALWETGNYDARNLALKVADPAQMTPEVLDGWARDTKARMCILYVAALTCETPHGMSRANAWLASDELALRTSGWSLVGSLALCDQTTPDAWFVERVAEIEKTIHDAPNEQRQAMNQALISLGCRTPALRNAAKEAAQRIGQVEIDHGDTACKTPEAVGYIDKAWEHSTAKGFVSPAAQERGREPMRLRC